MQGRSKIFYAIRSCYIGIVIGSFFLTSCSKKTEPVLSQAANDYQAWPKTRVDYTFNPYRDIDTGKPVQDTTYSPLLAQQWRTTLGARGIIANHSLNGVQASQFTALYPALISD